MTDDECSKRQPAQRPSADKASAASAQRTLRSEDLLAGDREVFITHGSEIYRLRLTRQGKLILQK